MHEDSIMTQDLTEKQSAVLETIRSSGIPLNPTEIAEKSGINYNTVRTYVRRFEEDGRIKGDRSGRYIYVVATETQLRKENNGLREVDAPIKPGIVSYPVMRHGPGAATPKTILDEEGSIQLPHSFLLRWIGRVPKEAYWTFVQGESMEPWLPDGSPILVEKCREVNGGGRYVLWLDDEKGKVVKRVERRGGGILHLISDNPAHLSIEVEHLEGTMFKDRETGRSMDIYVQGRIVYPPDTPQAILRMFAQQMAEVMKQR